MVTYVSNFPELLNFRFTGQTNAACWPRSLPGDYAEVVRLLGPGTGIVALDEDRLLALLARRSLGEGGPASPLAKVAIDQMLSDLSLLRDAGRDPVLNIVYGYAQDDAPPIASAMGGDPLIFPRDVFSWHVDSAPIESDTWLCTYHGAPSEGLLTKDALRKVDDPAIRAKLLELFEGEDCPAFDDWLAEHHYNLHYAARPKARPHGFGLHNLWRISCAWPGSPVPPCVHRAPATDSPRLLLIS